MDAGKIVETGTHKQLLKKGGYYNALYEAQFLAEEVA
jgi:ABC-type multidrug transport system fused ATPase/permease subunit